MASGPQIAVVGAGIVGASVAWYLARDGARVTVVEAAEAGGLATRRSWAWINASWGHPDAYVRLRVRSMEEWRELQAEVPGLYVDWCGGLVWDLPADDLRAFVAERQGQGYDIRIVDGAEASSLEPALADPPELAAHSPAEGSVEPLDATRALLAASARRGARVHVGQPVERLVERAARVAGVRLADGTDLPADLVVLAAGVATPRLAAQVGVEVPIDSSPGLLVSTEPVGPTLNGLVVGPGLELRQLRDGRLLGSGHYAGIAPDHGPDTVAAGLLQAIRSRIRGGESLRMQGYAVGHRPMPRDGLPIVGPAWPGLHVAVTHSGVTLAPIVGRVVAEEVLRGRRDPLIRPYGLHRFVN